MQQIQRYLGDEKLLYSYDAISTAATLLHLSPGGTAALVSFRYSMILRRFRPTTSEPQGQDTLPFGGGDFNRARTQVRFIVKVSHILYSFVCALFRILTTAPNDSLKSEGRAFLPRAREYLQELLESGFYWFISYQELPGGLGCDGAQNGSDMSRPNENHGDEIVIGHLRIFCSAGSTYPTMPLIANSRLH